MPSSILLVNAVETPIVHHQIERFFDHTVESVEVQKVDGVKSAGYISLRGFDSGFVYGNGGDVDTHCIEVLGRQVNDIAACPASHIKDAVRTAVSFFYPLYEFLRRVIRVPRALTPSQGYPWNNPIYEIPPINHERLSLYKR
jgi:hypothetical protein